MTRLRAAVAALAGLQASTLPSLASAQDEEDRFGFWIAQSFTHDGNVFRLAPEADELVLLGSPSRTDDYLTTSAGLRFNVPVAQQRIEGAARADFHRYDRFEELDTNARDGRVVWHWQAGERWRGDLGYATRKDLASLANVQGGLQSSVPNVLDTQRLLASFKFGLTPRWRLTGEASRQKDDNSADEFAPSDARIEDYRAGVEYESRAKNRMGVVLRRAHGDLSNPQTLGGLPVNNSYRHEGVEGFLEWVPRGHTRFTVRAGPVRREYDELPGRDLDDWTFHAAVDWAPAEQWQFGGAAFHDISPYEQVNVGLVMEEGLGFSATWKPVEKLDLTLRWHGADREYLGEAATAQGLSPVRKERVHRVGAQADWRPVDRLTIEFSARYERRSSPVPLGDYNATIAGVRVRFDF